MRVRGFTLIEVVIAMGLLVVLGIGASMLLTLTLDTIAHTRHRAMALVLARARLEQIVSLTGSAATGPSPPDSLATARAGYVDYFDDRGQAVAGAAGAAAMTIPASASYVRRWSIERSGTGAAELVIVQVMVTTAVSARAGAVAFGRSDRDAVWISGARLRRGP